MLAIYVANQHLVRTAAGKGSMRGMEDK